MPSNNPELLLKRVKIRLLDRLEKLVDHLPVLVLLISLMVMTLLLKSNSSADVYRYVDENQVIHLTNVPAGPKFRVLIRERSANPGPVSGNASYDELITGLADKYGVDSHLVKAVIKAESNFNHKAVSKKGAKGLMQLMPQTASSLGVGDSFHPGDNIDGGIRHLSYLLNLYRGDLTLTLAAYNAGEKAVTKYRGIPPYAETKAYVRQVLAYYDRYRSRPVTRSVASSTF